MIWPPLHYQGVFTFFYFLKTSERWYIKLVCFSLGGCLYLGKGHKMPIHVFCLKKAFQRHFLNHRKHMEQVIGAKNYNLQAKKCIFFTFLAGTKNHPNASRSSISSLQARKHADQRHRQKDKGKLSTQRPPQQRTVCQKHPRLYYCGGAMPWPCSIVVRQGQASTSSLSLGGC